MDNYYLKYIKYKSKYLDLYNLLNIQKGGSQYVLWYNLYEQNIEKIYNKDNLIKIDNNFNLQNLKIELNKILSYYTFNNKRIIGINLFKSNFLPLYNSITIPSGRYYMKLSNINKIVILVNKFNEKYHNDIIGFHIIKSKLNLYRVEIWIFKDSKNNKIIKYINKILKENYIKTLINFKKINYELYHFPKSNSLEFSKEDLNDSMITNIHIRNRNISFFKNDIIIGHKLLEGNWWELWMMIYFKKYYKPNTNMIDIGANIGTTSLLMEEILDENCIIYCFEPMFFNILQKNIYRNVTHNKPGRIMCYNYGLGNSEKTIFVDKINYSEEQNFGAFSLTNIDYTNNNKNKIPINIITLDSLNLQNISIIKIDVEGMDIDVLDGSYKTILREKPVIIIEILENNYNTFINSNIWKKLENIYYIKKISKQFDYKLIPKK